MPRKTRKISQTGIYHIMCRGNNKSDIFLDSEDRFYYLNIIKKIKSKHPFLIYAYCLMKNHIHILCNMQDESISTIMKKINVSYVYYFNKKYNRIGHLFQDRFKSECVEDEKYLLTVIRYIHNNPVKAEITKTPNEYRWCSFKDYRSISHKTFTDTEFILSIFSNDINKFSDFSLMINNDNIDDYKEEKNISITTVSEAKAFIEKFQKEFGFNYDKRNLIIQKIREKSNLSNKIIGSFFRINEKTVRLICHACQKELSVSK